MRVGKGQQRQRTNRKGAARTAPGQASGPSQGSQQIRGRFIVGMQGFCASFCHAIALLSVQTPRTAELQALTATAAFQAASAAAGSLYQARLQAPRAWRGCAGARVPAGASNALSSPVQRAVTSGLRTHSLGSCLGAAELLRAVMTAPACSRSVRRAPRQVTHACYSPLTCPTSLQRRVWGTHTNYL